jgi:hypothetical protein
MKREKEAIDSGTLLCFISLVQFSLICLC